MIRILLAIVVVAATVFFAMAHRPHHTGNLLPNITSRGVWYYGVGQGATGDMTEDQGAFRCNIVHSDGVDWHFMCSYDKLNLIEGHQYRVRFEAKASQNCVISVQARQESQGDTNLGLNQ